MCAQPNRVLGLAGYDGSKRDIQNWGLAAAAPTELCNTIAPMTGPVPCP